MVGASAKELAVLADRLVDVLGPAGEGRFFASLPEDREAIPSARFLDLDFLRAAIVRAAGGVGAGAAEVDLRPAASRWTRQYCAAVLPAVLVAMADGVALDTSLERCSIVLRGHLPGGLHLADQASRALRWPGRVGASRAEGQAATVTELRAHVVAGLFREHLVPLFERVLDLAKLSPDVLWSNVAEQADLVYEWAATRLDAERYRPFAEDAEALLGSAELPGLPGPNPLAGWITRDPVDEPDFPRPLQLRRVCCIHYLLPDRIGRLCSNCPLATTEERVELARSARGGRSLASTPLPARGPITSVGAACPGVGEAAPDFTLPATGGRTLALSSYRGKRAVVLYFYTADDGTACTIEAISFRDRYADFVARGVEVLGVSPDSVESHEAFRRKYDLPFPLLADTEHEVAERYGVWRLTKLMSKEHAGIVRTTFVVDTQGTISAVFTDVRGERHADHVLAVFD